MSRYFLSFAVLCAATLIFSFTASAQLPALIDREVFFGNPEIAGAQISPDGKFISFIKPLNEVRNVWVKGIDEPFSAARPLTNEKKRPISGYFWSRDGKYILFTKDNDGDENFNVYSVDPSAAVAKAGDVPAAKNLTDAKGIRAIIYGVPLSEPDFIYVGVNERDKAWHDLYKVQISTGAKTLLRENKDRLTGWMFDNKDKVRLATRSTDAGETEILKVDGDKFTKIYSCTVFETCGPIRFNKDDKRFYMVSDKGDARNFQQLVLFDPETMKEEFVEEDPLKRVDFGGANFSEVTKELIATNYEDDKERVYWKDKGYEADYKWLQGKLPNKELGLGSSTRDENLFIVSAYSDTEPGETYLFDRKAKKLTLQYKVREKLSRESLAPMKPIRYKSSDGLEIPAYLTLPKGVPAKNLPLLVFPHGGPWGRDSWGYSSFAQFFANRGYAVLQPNFRASTGYGKKFLDAGNLQWGDKMQDDLTWGVKAMIEQGIADPKRIGIMGGSYGGYATLAGVTYTPDTYAAAVAIVAPSNLITLLKSVPPYWEQIRTTFYKRMGDPNTPEGKAQLERQSPLNSANKIKTPLMIVQGANDPRVNKREADQIVIALRDRNYPVQYLLADDEGHGFARPVNNMAMIAESEKFLAKYLGGRFQETMSPEVAKRLKEITVDVKTVTLPVAPVAADMNAAPSVNITGKWNVAVDAQGQTLPVILELKQAASAFDGSMTSPLGGGAVAGGKVSGSNVTAIVKADLQGQAIEIALEGKVDGNKMTGTLNVPGFGILPFVAEKAP
jgi:dipeptidyl aminopeptidase/acylaminoacyl peptidase